MPYDYPVKFGKYLLTKRIAVGGMAELFLAKMIGIKGFEKILALKKILPEFGEDEEFVELFVDEAKMSVQLQHANIVQVFDFGEIDGSYYIAQEYVDGPNLKNLLKRCLKKKGNFPFEVSVFIILQMLKALDYAQRLVIGEKPLNLVHRDVSPQNILVSREGEVKITDFGIAKATIKASKTQPGKIQGKFSYMSPEQSIGSNIDHRSDIFSLGIIFFEMLTGYKLYSGEDTTTKYARVREGKIPPPSKYNPEIPRELETIVLKMLAKNPQDRYQKASDIQRELTDYLYPSSSELIAESLKTLVKDLFPVPLSQEKEIKVGKILEVEKDRSTLTDFKLIKKKSPLKTEEPLLLDKKKVTTRASIKLTNKSKKGSLLFKLMLVVFIIAGIYFFLREKRKIDKDIPKPTPTPSIEATSTPTPTPTETPTPLPTKKPAPKPKRAKKPVVIKPTPAPTPCPYDMAHIAKGPFLFGSPKDDPDRNFGEINQKISYVGSYCIDLYEYPNSLGVPPKTNLSFFEAHELCALSGKRLCSEMEWEKACSGKDAFKYPYGNSWSPESCNTQDLKGKNRTTASIGSFDSCKSPYGIFDMSGNVSEWTETDKGGSPVEKGGSSSSPYWQVRCSWRRDLKPDYKNPNLGLRCCSDPKTGDHE